MYHSPLTTFDAMLAFYDNKWFDLIYDCRILKSLLRRFGKQRMSYPEVLAVMNDRMARLCSILLRHHKPLYLITSFFFYASHRFGDHIIIGAPDGCSTSGIEGNFSSSERYHTDDVVICEGVRGYVCASYDRDIRVLLKIGH